MFDRCRTAAHMRNVLMLAVMLAGISHVAAKPNAPSAASPEDQQATMVVQARDAFQKGRLPELERLMARSQGQLLAAWPDYWRLKLLLGVPSADANIMRANLRAFMARHPQHPLTENAQRDWINALIAKNLWTEVAAALESLPESLQGPQIDCARAKLGMPAMQRQLKDMPIAVLAVGNETLDACLALIENLAKNEKVAAGYLRQRLRWVAQNGGESSLEKMQAIFKEHAKSHELGARGPDPLRTEMALARILKSSYNDSLSGLAAFHRQHRDLTHDQHQYASFAVGAALWRRSHAESWKMMLDGWSSMPLQPESALQIAAREAIRRADWPRLLEIIIAFREPTRAEPTWQYWRAIALRETKQKDLADTILRDLRDDFGFYGVLARELTGSPTRIPVAAPITLTPADEQRLNDDAGMQRSYALVRAGLRAEAVMEWSAAMRSRSDAELIRAALHARKAGFYDRMIAAADRTQREHDFSLRFPAPFKETVIPAAKEKSLDPWWVLGLIRQESRFLPDVKSSVGATGLMQIMPATGKMLAKNAGLKSINKTQLADVNTNVRLGTAYMRQLQDRFGGSALLASAAYNAGPSRALSWRSALPSRIDGAAFAESIPFPETRDYVKRVLTNAVLYHAVHNGGTVPSLKQLLGEVVPNES